MANAILLVHDFDGNTVDVYAPLDITAAELISALHEGLQHRGSAPVAMRAENPIAYISGGQTLEELGLRNGSNLYFFLEARFRAMRTLAIPNCPLRFDRKIETMKDHIRFGSSSECHVRFSKEGGAGIAFELAQNSGRTLLIARDADVGVNGKCVEPGQRFALEEGDFIHVSSAVFAYQNDSVLMSASIEVNGIPYQDYAEQNSHLIYPQMNRTSRFHDAPPTDSIEVLDPPALPEQQPNNILITILPTLLMAGLVLVTRSGSAGGGMIVFSALSMSVGAIGSVLSYRENNKWNAKKKEQREKSYLSYIVTRADEIQMMREKERLILHSIYITTAEELRNARDFSTDLFDRATSDADFLDIRLGYGLLPSAQTVTVKKHEAFEQTDALFEQPGRLARRFQFSENLPAVIRAREANAIGFQGDFTSLRWMMNQTVLDLASRHFPEDLKLYFLCGECFSKQVEAYRMLPHLRGAGPRRNISHDQKSRDELLEELYKILSLREEGALAGQPWIVVFVYADDEIMHHPVLKYIDTAAQLHCVFLFWAQFREQIPQGCSHMVRLFSNEAGGLLVDMFKRESDLRFDYDRITNEEMRLFSERLAPVYTSELSLSSTLVQSLSLYDMLHIGVANASEIRSQWRRADTCRSLAAPLGVIAGNQTLTLDLHEKAHGPHGLVAGTTGSGKSEILLSYVLSMAYHYSPNDVTFMIIDYKGSGLISRLEGLPHLTGTITNLNKRDLERSRIAIQAERLSRQRIFASAKVNDINEYTAMLHAGKVKQPLPHLIIIVDEFAELKSQQPEFMDDLISTARIGRSLGIHLILATQKPAGVINEQIWSNSDFKLCLRVQNKEDSNEVLHSPLAAEIREPGRAYLQVGRSGLFQLFQSGYGGAPVFGASSMEREYKLDKLSLSGRGECLFERKRQVDSDHESSEAQFVALRREIIAAFNEASIELPKPICLPPLPEKLPFEMKFISEDAVGIGVYDQPALQRMGDAAVRFASSNLLIAGGAQTGKTTLLQTIVRATAEKYSSKELNLYILDFNSGTFRAMENLDIIGGVVSIDQSERVRNLFKLLRGQIEARKAKMAEYGATSIRVYRELSGNAMPAICVMIDNFASFADLYDESYGEELEILLRDGLAVGISFIVTISNSTQISSRRMYYFTDRITLYQSDKSGYSSILDGCRKELPDVPGRALYPLENEFLEMQIYLPFGDVGDFERTKMIADFVEAHSTESKANAIPEVPDLLTHLLVQQMFNEVPDRFKYIYGMDYENVEPIRLDLIHQFELALVGKNDEAQIHFLCGLLMHLSHKSALGKMNVHIIDNYGRPLKAFERAANVYDYTLDYKQAAQMVKNAYTMASQRFETVREKGIGALDEVPLEVFIFNTQEVIKSISNDSDAMSKFNEMQEQYSNMRFLFLFGDIKNRGVTYSSPSLLRHLRDVQQAILFEGLSTGHMFEIDGMTVRANRAVLGRDDAYVVDDGFYHRIKLVWQEQ